MVSGTFALSIRARPGSRYLKPWRVAVSSWKLSLWGKRRAFTEGMEYVSAEAAKRTGGNFTEFSAAFNIVCNAGRNVVINAVGVLIAELLSTDLIPRQTLHLQNLEMRKSAAEAFGSSGD